MLTALMPTGLPARRPLAGVALGDDMDRLIRQVLGDWAGRDLRMNPEWLAPMSVHEDGDRWLVDVELPGIRPEDVDVQVDRGQLVVVAERQTPPADQRFAANTRYFGRIERSVTLPDGLDSDTVGAELKDGVLHLAFRKLNTAQARKVAVRSQAPDASPMMAG
jgi:HSP20 family protein